MGATGKKLTDDVDLVGADDGLGQLDVAGVADDDGPLGVLAYSEGDVRGGDETTLGRDYRVRGAVDLAVVDDPLYVGGRVRVVGRAGYRDLLLGLGLGRAVQVHAHRGDWNFEIIGICIFTLQEIANNGLYTYTGRSGRRGRPSG